MAFGPNGEYIPEWLPMDDEQQQTPDMGPFAQALKKRFASKPAQGNQPHTDTSGNMGGLHEGSGMGDEKMKSL